MKDSTKDLLFEAWDYCDENDKSTEFMIQYMQDTANVSFDTVIEFIQNTTPKQRREWYMKQAKGVVKKMNISLPTNRRRK